MLNAATAVGINLHHEYPLNTHWSEIHVFHRRKLTQMSLGCAQATGGVSTTKKMRTSGWMYGLTGSAFVPVNHEQPMGNISREDKQQNDGEGK